MSTRSRAAMSSALRSGRTLKRDDDGVRRRRQQHVRFVHRADAGVDDPDLHLLVGQLGQRVGQHLGRALHVGLDDDRQLLHAAFGNLRLQRLEREPSALGAERACSSPAPRGTSAIWRALAASATWNTSPGLRQPRRDRAPRPASTAAPTSIGLPRSSMSARTRPTIGPAMNVSPTRSVPSCTRTVATGPRPLSSFASSTVPDALPLGVGLQLADFGDEQNHFEQQIEVLLLLRRHVDRDGCAAPFFGHQVEIGQFALDPLGVGVRLVDLVDRHDDRHVRRSRVIDCFPGLRHDAVVSRNHQNDDVGDLGAAGAHQRERLVARRVEEHDVAAVDGDVIRADVLRDAAGFAFGDARLADGVEQARLAVVDVAHHRDDRRAGDDVFGIRFDGVDLQTPLRSCASGRRRRTRARSSSRFRCRASG